VLECDSVEKPGREMSLMCFFCSSLLSIFLRVKVKPIFGEMEKIEEPEIICSSS
jgi:hypothetical protein